MVALIDAAEPPAGFERLEPKGVRCRCINLFLDAEGYGWCGHCGDKQKESHMVDQVSPIKGDAPVQLVTTKPDTEIAADLKTRIEAALVPVCLLMDEANAAGMVVTFNLAPQPPLNRNKVAGIAIAKHF